jgi:hypothetical protein
MNKKYNNNKETNNKIYNKKDKKKSIWTHLEYKKKNSILKSESEIFLKISSVKPN